MLEKKCCNFHNCSMFAYYRMWRYGSLSKLPSSSFHEDKQKLTIMHIDADNKRFQDFIEETEKKLDMEITVEKCPSNADNRQAKISTILASGTKILI